MSGWSIAGWHGVAVACLLIFVMPLESWAWLPLAYLSVGIARTPVRRIHHA